MLLAQMSSTTTNANPSPVPWRAVDSTPILVEIPPNATVSIPRSRSVASSSSAGKSAPVPLCNQDVALPESRLWHEFGGTCRSRRCVRIPHRHIDRQAQKTIHIHPHVNDGRALRAKSLRQLRGLLHDLRRGVRFCRPRHNSILKVDQYQSRLSRIKLQCVHNFLAFYDRVRSILKLQLRFLTKGGTALF